MRGCARACARGGGLRSPGVDLQKIIDPSKPPFDDARAALDAALSGAPRSSRRRPAGRGFGCRERRQSGNDAPMGRYGYPKRTRRPTLSPKRKRPPPSK